MVSVLDVEIPEGTSATIILSDTTTEHRTAGKYRFKSETPKLSPLALLNGAIASVFVMYRVEGCYGCGATSTLVVGGWSAQPFSG